LPATDIKLVRKKADVPDFGRNLTILYREKNFPLQDDDGNIKLSTDMDASGNLIPQYFDFVVTVQVPSPIPAQAQRQAFIDDLKAQADTQAKIIAQKRANDIIDKNKINSIVKSINDDQGIFFTGTYDVTGL
jgi:hypothetical protein